MKMWDIRDGKPYPMQFSDEDRYDPIPRGKTEYILLYNKDMLGSLKSTKALDNAIKYGNTIHVKPKDYYNRYKDIKGIIITKNSMIYKAVCEVGRQDDLILYDAYKGGK